MRFEGKSEQEAIETALKELKRPASQLQYRIVRDEKSFWGGRVVEIEVEAGGASAVAPEPEREQPSAPGADSLRGEPAARPVAASSEMPEGPTPAKAGAVARGVHEVERYAKTATSGR